MLKWIHAAEHFIPVIKPGTGRIPSVENGSSQATMILLGEHN